jgi:hypothetical protein
LGYETPGRATAPSPTSHVPNLTPGCCEPGWSGKLKRVWFLDATNSPDLIRNLRPHAQRGVDFSVAWVGEGWRPLVVECHNRLTAAFPDYELLAIKQKYGVLEFQAFPKPRASAEQSGSSDEYLSLLAITDEIRDRSERVCEWCGAAGRLRESRTLELTLCDVCDDTFPDPPEIAQVR